MRLILVRHAKSSWDYPSLHDHDRPLSKRGRRASDAVGTWLAEQGYIPRSILSSTSSRTIETWTRMSAFLPRPSDVRFERELYHCGPREMLERLRLASRSPVLLLGHNPGIAAFAESILEQPPSHFDFGRFPTAATLVCDLPANAWSSIEYGTGKLVAFVTPRDL